MTTAVAASAEALAATGATPKDLSDGQTEEGAPKAPAAPANAPPAKTPEELAAEKAAADKAALEEGPGSKEKQETPEEKEAREAEEAEAAALAEKAGDWQDEYITFEDPNANAVVDILKEKGVSVIEANAIFAGALKSGDLKDVDWTSLEKKLGPSATVLARAGIEAYANGALKQNRQIVEDTYKQVGGEANWLTMRNWAQAAEKADTSGKFTQTLDNIRAAINLGGAAREDAISRLKALYDADPKTKGLGTFKLTTGDQPAGQVGAPMTRAEYLKAVHEAHARKAPAHELRALDARRMAGKAARI